MRASAIEFRLRMLINAVIIVTGFWTPWIGNGTAWAGFAPHVALLEWLALRMSRAGLTSFTNAVPIVIAVAALCAAVGAVLRVWGTANLGSGTVHSLEMRAGAVVASGPYRYVRNPLYMGVWFMVAALAFLMPPTGALFTMVLISLFQLRLILGEEAFLARQIGEPYLAYKRAVPRLVPRLRGAPAASGEKPQWLHALLTEITPIGVFVALAFFSWNYNNGLMERVILISFGLSLVMRALLMGKRSEAAAPKTYS
ncbi:MAG TPA: isoprenylcysteine carboxylmethyltransferase family protein [Terracidiphilus sp.]|nr:isoprenylcysteine carboxylmethyltransferase family protein [Terracidiphilus sp.]